MVVVIVVVIKHNILSTNVSVAGAYSNHMDIPQKFRADYIPYIAVWSIESELLLRRQFEILSTLDTLRYHITRYHTQCTKVEHKTSVRLRSQGRHPDLALTRELWVPPVSHKKEIDSDISRAHCNHPHVYQHTYQRLHIWYRLVSTPTKVFSLPPVGIFVARAGDI